MYICTYTAPQLSNWFKMACCLFHFLYQTNYLCVYFIHIHINEWKVVQLEVVHLCVWVVHIFVLMKILIVVNYFMLE